MDTVVVIFKKFLWRDLYLKLFIRLAKKKRAISPVIAIVLLIGLAVAATAAIFLVVLPLMQPKPDLKMTDAYILYDDDYTEAADEGEGYGKGIVVLANAGTGKSEITNISISYSIVITGPWNPIPGAISLQSITPDNPYEVEPIEQDEELTVRFPLPDENDDQTVFYRIVVKSKEEADLDTIKETETVSEEDMQLSKDSPDISFTETLDYIRRSKTFSPFPSDNSKVKNVTYEVSTDSGFTDINITKVITDSGVANRYPWKWDTYRDSSEGLDNGTYYLRMTVYDYAGLSDTVDTGSFIVDNDYVPPTIGGLWITDPYPNNQTAEVGQSISFTVEITDGGTEQASASVVDSAILYYRINGSLDVYSVSPPMTKSGTTNNWTASIDPIDVDSTALENGIECYVESEDKDGNKADTSGNLKIIPVDDHVKPDISHTSTQSANWDDLFINITAIITDKDQVNESNVKLYYRQTDDYGGKTISWASLSPLVSGNEYAWLIWSTDISIHGLDYFFNATDRFSGRVANAGTETTPYHISIPDTLVPTIDHTAFTSVTHDVNLTVECVIFDNDPTFGAENDESGIVTLHYRNNVDGSGTVFSTDMKRISGNSSIDNNYETPSSTVWSGKIIKDHIQDDGNPSQLDYYIKAIDNSTNLVQHGNPFHYVPVIAQGDPNILFVSGSMSVSGTRGEQIYFEIENKLGSQTYAEVGKLNLTILSDTADFSSDYPKLNMTNFNGSTKWSNATGVLNKTWITLSDNYTIGDGFAAGITMTFENESGLPYSMYDLELILELEVYNNVGSTYFKKLTNLVVPPGYVSEKRYMTSSYTLSTQGTTTQTQQNTPWHYATSPTVQWGIRVFAGASQITPISETRVSGSTGWSVQTGTWKCPQTSLNPTDSITISVRAWIGGSEYTLADFSTGPLGAKELKGDVEWTIQYYVYYQYITWGRDRTRAFFGFGELYPWDSNVDNFTYRPA